MATILLKRGLQTDISNLSLAEGELALAYSADKTKIELYAGDGKGGKVLVNPDVTVPAKVSDLTNDSGFQTASEVEAAIAAAGLASFRKVDSVPTASSAEENVLYLVMNSTTNHYDIYAKVGTEVVLLDDTTVDLSGYVKKQDVDTALSDTSTNPVANKTVKTALDKKVDSVSGKQLSTEDYTSAEKTKLSGIATGANNYTHPSTHAATMITQDSTHRFVTDTEKTTWNSKLDASSTIDCGTF